MNDAVCMQGPYDGDLIGLSCQLGKQIRHQLPGFTLSPKSALATQQQGIFRGPLRLDLPKTLGNGLAVQPVKQRFRVERFHLTRTTRHEQENNGRSLRRKMWQPGRQGVMSSSFGSSC